MDLRSSWSRTTVQFVSLQTNVWSGFKWTPFTGNIMTLGNIKGEYLRGKEQMDGRRRDMYQSKWMLRKSITVSMSSE